MSSKDTSDHPPHSSSDSVPLAPSGVSPYDDDSEDTEQEAYSYIKAQTREKGNLVRFPRHTHLLNKYFRLATH